MAACNALSAAKGLADPKVSDEEGNGTPGRGKEFWWQATNVCLFQHLKGNVPWNPPLLASAKCNGARDARVIDSSLAVRPMPGVPRTPRMTSSFHVISRAVRRPTETAGLDPFGMATCVIDQRPSGIRPLVLGVNNHDPQLPTGCDSLLHLVGYWFSSRGRDQPDDVIRFPHMSEVCLVDRLRTAGCVIERPGRDLRNLVQRSDRLAAELSRTQVASRLRQTP